VDSIFDTLVDPAQFSADPIKVIHAFNHVKGFFVNPRGSNPYERYGIPVVKVSTLDFIKSEIKRLLAPVKNAFKNLTGLESQFNQTLEDKSESLRRYMTTSVIPNLADQEEVEIESENEQEQELMQEQEQEFKLHAVDPIFSKPQVPWDRDRFFKGVVFDHPTTQAEIQEFSKGGMNLGQLSPVISLADVFEIGGFRKYSEYFDSEIFASLNLFPVFKTNRTPNSSEFKPFGVYQGLIDHALVVLNEDNTVHSIVLITRDEALSILGEWLVEDRIHSYSQMKGRSYLVYQFGNGFIRNSSNLTREMGGIEPLSLFIEKLESDPKLKNLLVQAQFLSGRTNYSEDEQKILASWIKEKKGFSSLYEFFVNKILEFKETTKEGFHDSTIFHILKGESDDHP
jgi:hypothetical protein